MDIQLTRHNSKDLQTVEKRQDSQQGWTFNSQDTIQKLTRCEEKAGHLAGTDIQLIRHNSKTHKLWKEPKTVSKDGHSAHKAQFKDSQAVERTQDSQQGWTFSSQGTIRRLTSCRKNPEQLAWMDIQLTKHNSETHILQKEPRTVSRDEHSAHKAQFKDSHPVKRRQDSQQGWTFNSQGTIQRLTFCGEKTVQSARMVIQLTRHNPKTYELWREPRTISKDGHSTHKAQFKDSQAVDRTQNN
jgi:hypothetical protein